MCDRVCVQARRHKGPSAGPHTQSLGNLLHSRIAINGHDRPKPVPQTQKIVLQGSKQRLLFNFFNADRIAAPDLLLDMPISHSPKLRRMAVNNTANDSE
ncbi:hypothetical protein WA026_015912 [Henosepilachna vigintioctopunctata]|uniref:Uncharacterized protein n=1 Tax=Henosepilachna vigintioctopunctata TaxID=420089 RepID=A0AAW1U8C1_9CUCU